MQQNKLSQPNKEKEKKAEDPFVVARTRPPALETFFVAMLRSFQMVCFLGSGVALVKFFLLPDWNDVIWLAFAIFGAHLLSFYRGLWLEEAFRPNHIFVIMSELLAIFIGMRVVAVLFGFTADFVNLAFLLNFGFVGWAWWMGRSWLQIFYYLYEQPGELPGAAGTNISSDNRAFVDHRQAYRELKGAWRWMAGFQIVLVIGGISLALLYKERAGLAELTQTLIIAGTIHLLLGLPLLAWARLRYLRTGWTLTSLKEPARLSTRWSLYLLALLLLALLPAIALSFVDLTKVMPPLPEFKPRPQQEITPFAFPTGQPLLRGTPLAPPPAPEPQEPFRLPNELTIILLSLVVTTIIYAALQLLISAGWVGPRWRKFSFPVMWGHFWKWLKSLFGPRRPREGFEKVEREARSGLFSRFRRERLPNDPRGRVRFHYRQMVQRATRAGLPRHTSQTPEEYAGFLAPRLEEPELTPDLRDLTGLYEEARFSPHPIAEEHASEARQHSEKLTDHLRHKSRRDRGASRKPAPPENKS